MLSVQKGLSKMSRVHFYHLHMKKGKNSDFTIIFIQRPESTWKNSRVNISMSSHLGTPRKKSPCYTNVFQIVIINTYITLSLEVAQSTEGVPYTNQIVENEHLPTYIVLTHTHTDLCSGLFICGTLESILVLQRTFQYFHHS